MAMIYLKIGEGLESQAALIESPGLYQDMTGRDNIELIANLGELERKE